MKRSLSVLGLMLCVILPLHGKPPVVHAASDLVRLPGHVLPALTGATPVSATPGADAEPLTLTLVLKREDQIGLEQYLHDVNDPSSPNYRRFLTQHELAERFGPSREAYDGVLTHLQHNGFTLVEGSANRLTLTVRGRRADAERTFALHIGEFKIGDRSFFANDADPGLPVDVARNVSAISGLSNLALPRPQIEKIRALLGITICDLEYAAIYAALFVAASNEAGKNKQSLTAAQLDKIAEEAQKWLNKCIRTVIFTYYGLPPGNDPPPPAWQGVDGTGQTIGLLEFDTFNLSDVSDYIHLIGLPASTIGNISQVDVNGGVRPPPGPNQDEVLIDINAVLLIAPGAKIVVYDGPFSGTNVSFQAMFNAMINGGVNIISNSWAYCEDQTTLADVQSIDALLQSAAASGISVFNATGDTGSTCLDGSSNTIAVPADSPSATAVGGMSLTPGPGNTYGSETWWNGTNDTPPTGQGGYGVSRFFPRPNYQTGFTSSAMRSVPDVVVNADPAHGILICNASQGGCPTGTLNAGTSLAAPAWAAFTALLNQAQGSNLGGLNPRLYAVGNTDAFHSASSMSSDFAHVGLGSPNLSNLHRRLTNQTVGPVSGPDSEVRVFSSNGKFVWPGDSGSPLPIYADGAAKGSVGVRLIDAFGNIVSGHTVTLSANGGNAQINPPSGVTTVNDGAVVFTVTNLTPETVTFTARDTTSGVVLNQQVTMTFVVPPAASAGISASRTTVAADGIDTTTITVTLKDALNRPTPFKEIRLAQGNGHSLITGPDPSVTDSNGQIQFTATNLVNEVVTYTAVDVTDGDLPVPGNAVVTFNNGSGTACGQNTSPVGLNGYTVSPFATGFVTGSLFFGNINFGGCSGVLTPAFLGGSVYVPNFFNGDLFKLGAGGGAVSNANKLTTIGPTLGWPVVGKDGRLYAIRVATHASPPNFTDGAILEIDPNTGAVLRTVAANLACSQGLVVDPLSGDLFFDDECFGAGFDPSLFRVRNPSSANPTVEVYATLPFITTNPPTTTAEITDGIGGGIIGPDGCLYMPNQNIIYKLTDPTGGCSFASASVSPSLSLTPTAVSPNPPQGSEQTFTATFHNVTVPADTPVFFLVTGANPQFQLVRTVANGQAALTYTAVNQGKDTIVATATVNNSALTSNKAQVTWTAGKHVTFLTLNPSPTGTTTGQPVVVIASLTDISRNPTARLAGQSISFALGSQTCPASTDPSGIAACLITPLQAGLDTLTATFAGTSAFVASHDSVGFNVVAPQVAETTPPVLTISASPKTLWPPNGKMVPVTISGTITDAGSGVKASTATYAVIDEYGSVHPSGPITLGSNGSYSFTIQLQASRNGNDQDGRHYTITVRAQDNAGNNGSASTGVTVPHDQGN